MPPPVFVLIVLIRFLTALVLVLYAAMVCDGYPALAGIIGLAACSSAFRPVFSLWFVFAFGVAFLVIEHTSNVHIARLASKHADVDDNNEGGE